jgi:hypothetical protein
VAAAPEQREELGLTTGPLGYTTCTRTPSWCLRIRAALTARMVFVTL